MSLPKNKESCWAELSLAFDKVETMIPRNREKKATKTDEKLFVKPSTVGFKKPETIVSLSELIAACEPGKTTELSVSKQKQKEIENWFVDQAFTGKPKILVISGPSGCGKTAALKIIAKDNAYECVEWTTPADSVACKSDLSTQQSDKFLDFLIRATRYNSLFQTSSQRLLLVKDIPNVFLTKPDIFFTVLENYFQYGKKPLVFICTDWGNSRMLKTLFPSDVKEKFHIDVISVNSTTQTAMKKMLKRVSVILNSRGCHIIDIKENNIDQVLSNGIGDVRSTILNLIFNSLKVADNNLKHDCGTREESLGLLHGIGRVINPKRMKTGDNWKFVHDPDNIASYFQSQSKFFLYFLHENYIKTMAGIEEIELCADILSLSDLITYEWRDLVLTEVNLSFCVRGIMVNNKNPVTGWNPVRKPFSGEVTASRNLGSAEERWYKSIICPQEKRDLSNLDNTIMERYSD